MGIEGTRARSHAHGKRKGRLTVHILVVAMAVGAVLFASQFPNSSSASTTPNVPGFAFSGLGGASNAKAAAYFRPSASTQTLDSVAALAPRVEVANVRAIGGQSPTGSLSSGVAAAAANSGEVGAGTRALADIIDPRSPVAEYKTQAGDTLSGIAQKYGVSMETILDNNPTLSARSINLIPRDLVLIIPRAEGIIHKVASGETVASIVAQYDNITVNRVVEFRSNGISDPNSLESGKLVLLPGATFKPPPPPPPPPPRPPSVPSGSPNSGAPAPSGGGRFQNFPLASWHSISDPYGTPRGNRYHTGIDLDLYGYGPSAIYSVCDGTVSVVEYLTYSYGYYVVVDCGDGWTTLYAHMSEIHVSRGQAVGAGTTLGLSGLTGFTTGHHLHFEIRYNGAYVNPADYLGF
jgi:murein DD-endopeptidase MepM/ murein hydrolase activator NlpD